ncbi:hypothetical protein EVAR_52790_1 [Eumeta japonica]|uniref:Ig-like domain-containing protein n=1 Tax=Eumeta variegata TaxID=151549 RepID=A0A4C1Z8V8_EUMVA|nr:hypothetical protein EVAR_52790_1 [Eumeta japonica]
MSIYYALAGCSGNRERRDERTKRKREKEKEAKAHILGPADLYVKTGSSLSLTCVLSQGPHDLGTIFWYKGSTIIEYKELEDNELTEEPRLKLKTEWTEQLTSKLTISPLLPMDSGNYSCVPTMAEPASVNVHVINGEHPAAMQHGNANTASPCALSVNVLISLYCTLATMYTSNIEISFAHVDIEAAFSYITQKELPDNSNLVPAFNSGSFTVLDFDPSLAFDSNSDPTLGVTSVTFSISDPALILDFSPRLSIPISLTVPITTKKRTTARARKLRSTDQTLHRTPHRLATAFFARRFDARV